MKSLAFTKMEGLGNDFIVIDGPAISGELARKLCDRRFGVGADQVLCLSSPQSKNADVRMDILNADGSVAEMCGNGIRAAALYFHSRGPKKSQANAEYRFETLGGIKLAKVSGPMVNVDMGIARLAASDEALRVGGKELRFIEANLGNPHAVFFVDDPRSEMKLGPEIETHSRFPERTNVEFVKVTGSDSIEVHVWERGAGATLACGTGACASACAAIATGRVKSSRVHVKLPGGNLTIDWAGKGQPVFMTGPAREVFTGEFFL